MYEVLFNCSTMGLDMSITIAIISQTGKYSKVWTEAGPNKVCNWQYYSWEIDRWV